LIGKTCRVGFSVAFIACIAALAALAWLPAGAVTRTPLGGHAEHFIAWLGTAIVMGLTCPGRPRPATQAVLLIVYAAILEAGQLQASGRHASLHDFAFSAAGVATGVLGLFLMRVLPAALPFVVRRRDGAVGS
jgi:VanZ family protein